jgi:hypothetical protein
MRERVKVSYLFRLRVYNPAIKQKKNIVCKYPTQVGV